MTSDSQHSGLHQSHDNHRAKLSLIRTLTYPKETHFFLSHAIPERR